MITQYTSFISLIIYKTNPILYKMVTNSFVQYIIKTGTINCCVTVKRKYELTTVRAFL